MADELLDDYLSGKTAGSNLSAFDRVLEMTGNPLFLYQQGIITPEMLLNAVRMATSRPLDTSVADWKMFEDAATNNPMLLTAYDMIKKGYSVGSTLDTLYQEFEDKGLAETSGKRLQFIQSDLEEFKKRWDAANDIARRVDAGDLFEDSDGTVRERLDTAQAMSVLGRMGMPQLLQNPMMWEIIPDANLLAKATEKGDEAKAALQALGKIATPAEYRKINKAATKEAISAEQKMLQSTLAGRQALAERNAAKARADAKKKAEAEAKNVSLRTGSGQALVTLGKKIVNDFKDKKPTVPIQQKLTQGLVRLVLGKGEEKKEEKKPLTPSQAADWNAKMTAYYTGRGAQETGMKPITDLQKRAKEAEAEALKILAEARAKGTPAALQFVNQGLGPAMALTQGTGAPARRAPRTLSDAEIDQMSSMLAYGG